MNEIIVEINNILDICDEINISIENGNADFLNVIELVDNLAVLARKIDEYKNQDINLEEYNEKLIQLLNSLENKDMDLFSDTLKYDFKPLLEYWRETLEK
ncbi:hypothetical protein [Clostridium lundense]|uniref:hypothetical protein n=1 Tax=Clostridium lundense TaxID=319475 RepID=UPI000484D132|nr:hypothetical protein [Clostridium lundense]